MNFYAMENNGGTAWSPILGQGNFHKATRFGKVTWATKEWLAAQMRRCGRRWTAAPTDGGAVDGGATRSRRRGRSPHDGREAGAPKPKAP